MLLKGRLTESEKETSLGNPLTILFYILHVWLFSFWIGSPAVSNYPSQGVSIRVPSCCR